MSSQTNYQWQHWPDVRPVDLQKIDKLEEGSLRRYQFECMRTWIKVGRPYFKVWPGILEEMLGANVDIDCAWIRFPFPVISILLPPGELRNEVGASLLAGIFPNDGHYSATPGASHHVGIVTDGQRGKPCCQINCRFHLVPGTTVASAIREMLYPARQQARLERKVPALVRVAIATALFGFDSHEVVLPDIKRELLVPQGRTKGQRQIDQQRVDKLLKTNRGWTVGREIILPRPKYARCSGQLSTHSTRDRTQSHIRRAHMRMQPCGEGGKDRKLVFIRQTIVMPELPMKSSHGFGIRHLNDRPSRRRREP